ncbi:MAG TPA: hypothetical protein VJ484_07615, partial [Lysobacter sp.]|nr:hypothetical protein [Lysobacter sp.]
MTTVGARDRADRVPDRDEPMPTDAIPIPAVFVGTIIVVMLALEVGYRLGSAVHRRSADEKESPVSVIAGAILALATFMLAFTFGIVADRYDSKK